MSFVTILAAVVLLGAWPACAAEQVDHFNVRIQLKWFHQFQFAGYYAAVEKGYFREAGLDVTLIEGGPRINPTEQVLAGYADFGIGTSGLLAARSRGRPIVAVAAIFQHSPYIIITRDDPDIQSLKDLEGRTIMVEPYAEELITYLHHEGVNPDAIQMTDHTGNPLDIYSGDVVGMTAYTTTEPFILNAHDKPYHIFDPKVAGIDFYGDTLYTSEAFANQHHDKVTALRDAVIRGWRYALRNQDEVIELIRQKYHVKDSARMLRFEADEIRRLSIPDLVEIGYMNPARWQRIANEFRAAGLMEGNVDIDDFIFRPNEISDWKWLLYTLLATIIITLLITIILVKFYKLNRELKAENEMRIALEKELREHAITDFGTGVFNRRGFLEAMQHELDRSDRTSAPLSLLEFDLDHFKQVNDTYGHAVGDQILSMVASICHYTVRGIDIIGRMGGEEFMIALPDTDTRGAYRLAERLLENIQSDNLPLEDGHHVTITVSIGVVTRRGSENVESMMRRADRAMYQAKNQGRNKVCVKENPHFG